MELKSESDSLAIFKQKCDEKTLEIYRRCSRTTNFVDEIGFKEWKDLEIEVTKYGNCYSPKSTFFGIDDICPVCGKKLIEGKRLKFHSSNIEPGYGFTNYYWYVILRCSYCDYKYPTIKCKNNPDNWDIDPNETSIDWFANYMKISILIIIVLIFYSIFR